ncbi:Hydrolase (HAD superfamily) [Streptococcus thermophilus CNCM I-1630]|nr:Hydrolase (HAD superfamily) [Streptococcus thermophilus CNCM I-1630]
MRKSTDDLIPFGDEHNDTEMLELAKTGYAMKNASSVLLPHANEQIEWTNEEDRRCSQTSGTTFINKKRHRKFLRCSFLLIKVK